MKTLILILLICPSMLILACSGKAKNTENEMEKVKWFIDENQKPNGHGTTKETKKHHGNPLADFALEDHTIFDTVYGDLNKDDILDCILILKSKKEENNGFGEEINRPLILLIGASKDSYVFAGRNDRVVYCKACGGVWGDPYEAVTIKNGYFSVEHYGGSNWRWTRIITFKYNEKKKNWFLHRDGGDSFHTSDPESIKTEVKTTKDFGIVSFEEFNNF